MNTANGMQKYLWQIGILFSLCVAGEGISLVLPFAFPGSVIALVLLFILLALKWLKPGQIREASDFLLQNMAFLFVPSSVGIMQQVATLRSIWLPFLLICLTSTVLTFFAASTTVRLVMRLQDRLAGRGRAA